MTAVQEVSAAPSRAKVHEFTTDVLVQRRHAAADGVVALDLVDPQGGDLPAGSPERTSTCCSARAWFANTRCAVIHATPRCGAWASCSTPTVAVAPGMYTRISRRAQPCEFGVPATISGSSTRRSISSSPVASGSLRSWR